MAALSSSRSLSDTLSDAKPEAIERYDNPEPLFPGEHWVDLAGGIAAWLLTRKHPSLAVRTLGTFLGATLVARAAHGHRQMSSIMRWTPIGGGIKRN
jgi:hypothetical protein